MALVPDKLTLDELWIQLGWLNGGHTWRFFYAKDAGMVSPSAAEISYQ